jgi:hypothetical protein
LGRDEQMRLSEGLINSEMSLYQQVQLAKEEDMRNLLMIGGIEILLPLSQEEAEICVVGATTTEGQLAKTVKEELEQISKVAREKEENEHSEEWLNAFIWEVEKRETIALKLTVEEVKEQAGKFITPWEMELEML